MKFWRYIFNRGLGPSAYKTAHLTEGAKQWLLEHNIQYSIVKVFDFNHATAMEDDYKLRSHPIDSSVENGDEATYDCVLEISIDDPEDQIMFDMRWL